MRHKGSIHSSLWSLVIHDSLEHVLEISACVHLDCLVKFVSVAFLKHLANGTNLGRQRRANHVDKTLVVRASTFNCLMQKSRSVFGIGGQAGDNDTLEIARELLFAKGNQINFVMLRILLYSKNEGRKQSNFF